MRRRHGLMLGVVLLALHGAAAAKVTADEAAKLGRELTLMGAEVAANREGVIPPWNGGYNTPPACFRGAGSRYCDPFGEDRPLYTVNRDNLLQHSGQLSAGQVEMFRQHPGYQLRVYPTRRSFANPQRLYSAAQANALKAELTEDGEGLKGATAGTPFPIPADGREVVWNHRLRYRGGDVLRWNLQYVVNPNGESSWARFGEEASFYYNRDALADEDDEHLLGYFFQVATGPERLIGSALLLHETLNPARRERRSWLSSPGRRKLRPESSLGHDTPGIGADGLRTNDQTDTFSGSLERYNWKLIGKKELLVPANSYALHSDAVRYENLVRPGHLNQELARYELRRVWQVEATLAKTASHLYRRRTFYLDEDGWQIRIADLYDGRDQLWRLQEAHTVMAYDQLYELPVAETVYDLQNRRYLVQALNNEEAETANKDYPEGFFEPSRALRRVPKN